MVATRISRFAIEVLADAPSEAALHRQSAEVVVAEGDADTGLLLISRFAVEVMGDTPQIAALHRQSAEVVAEEAAADSSASMKVARFAIEALADTPDYVSLHRQSAEIAVVASEADASAAMKIVRFAIEVLGDVQPTVTARDLPIGLELPLHDWSVPFEVETSFRTDIQMAETVAEKRRGLSDKPYRLLKARWLAGNRAEADRAIRMIRKATAVEGGAALYADQVTLDVTVGSVPSTTIYVDTTERRFYIGGHVALVEVDRHGHATGEVEFRKIEERYSDRLVLDSGVSSMTAGLWLVMPVVNIDRVFNPSWALNTDRILNTTPGVIETFGKSALPPADSGLPYGFSEVDGLPIWDIEPDWSEAPTGGYKLEGDFEDSGRSQIAVALGDRARALSDGSYLMRRADWWRALRFHNSRRGELLPFLKLDQESIFDVVSIDPSGLFVSIDPFGDVDDFSAELTYLGLVMSDGRYLVREVVTVQDIFGVWRVTLATALPSSLDAADVVRVAPARVVRFAEGAMKESWITTDIVKVSGLSTIELLREGDVAT